MHGTFTTATAVGGRSHQEDRFFIGIMEQGILLGVFDGHGGEECSDHLAKTALTWLYDEISKSYKKDGAIPVQKAFKLAFANMAKMTSDMHCGSTASIVFIPTSQRMAYVAVLGDSPVIVGKRKGFHLGPDHNARSNEEECRAAVKRGARWDGNYLWDGYGDNAHGIQMARAFGDKDLPFLSRVPQTYRTSISEFVLIGTDGLFDPTHKSETAVSNVVDLVQQGATAQQLVDNAVALPTGDNATAILWRR